MIDDLRRAAKAARIASMPIGGARGIAIVLLEEGIMVRGWDTSQKGECRSSVIVEWDGLVRDPMSLDNAVAMVTGTLDRALNR